MLRGLRWQLLALLVAAGIFIVALITRTAQNTDPAPTATPTIASPTATLEAATPTAVAITEEATQPTPIPGDGVTTYTEAVVGEVQRLNPVFADLNPVDADITALIFEGLTRINAYGELEPALAEDWVVSFDGLEYVFILRDDVLWQDGTPFTAADVVYTTSILGSADFPGDPALGEFWRTVETEQISDTLVRFRLTQPLGSFPEALRIGMLPVHALRGTTALQLASHPFNFNPIGTGPYQLEYLGVQEGDIQTVDLRVAPVYRQRPEGQSGYELDRVRFELYEDYGAAVRALQAGEVDAYATRDNMERLPLLDLAGTIVPHTAHEPATGMLIFNWVEDDLWFFREQRVRQALSLGLDRSSIIQRHLLNQAVQADSPLPSLSWAYDGGLNWPGYDPVAAQELLAIANAAAERTLARQAEASDATEEVTPDASISFTILTPDTPALVNVAGEIATQWAQLDVTAIVEPVNMEEYRQRLQSSDFDAALVELSKEGSADPDVYAFWHQGQYPDGQNYGGANDRAISEALERARRDPNGTNRAIHYRTFQREFIDRAIALPLYYPLFTYAITPELTGVQLGLMSRPSDRFLTIKAWRFE